MSNLDITDMGEHPGDYILLYTNVRHNGWIRVNLPFVRTLEEKDAIAVWVSKNLKHSYINSGTAWAFENETDASYFILKYLS